MESDPGRRDGLLVAIVESSDDSIFAQTLDGTILSWNPAAERLYGYSAAEAIGAPISMLLPPDRAGELHAILTRVAAGERVVRYETRRVRKDGEIVDVAVTVSPVHDRDGRVVGASSIARDIGGRMRQEESYRHLFELHPSPMWLFDLETLRFLAVNDAAVAAYGWSREEFLAMTIEDIRPAADHAAIRAEVKTLSGLNSAGIWRHLHKDGSLHDVAMFSNAVEFDGRTVRLVLAQDVTEQRRLEEQLVQAQKIEAIGALAAGVAHDFNNVLMVVRACSALLLKTLTDEGQRRDAAQIDEAAQRGAELTRQLLAFSKQQVLRPELTDVNVVVHQTLELLERVIGEDVEIKLDLTAETSPILVDRGQLGQVIINLAVNARDAMPDGGTLSLSTSTLDLDEGYAFAHAGVVPGRYVCIQVTDSGIGMGKDTREHVFDPFFTTKETGTGLGLSTVHGIVKQSGGHIWLYTEPGLGATFKLYFPIAGEGVARRPAEPAPVAGSARGDETILFVEDEETVRVIVAETLRSYGYTVLEAGGGAEAIRLVAEHAGSIDLLLTDVVMPGMNGRELAEKLTGEHPGLALVYTSGYPADSILRDGISEARATYVQKPYDPSELAATVRGALDAARPG
ncbi:MAG TPA: PAS domain S-box protein [Gaiellaceae bacterium]|nr:PAS domain S-box protein [Gaiellaceae bacterium]